MLFLDIFVWREGCSLFVMSGAVVQVILFAADFELSLFFIKLSGFSSLMTFLLPVDV